MNTAFPTVEHEADLCVVGGGLAGLCAAVSAARHGARVLLMQDRPMLGGNASSEIRMWVCGAHGDNNRETGLLEEISMDNMARNPDKNYSIWDGILYEKARYQPGIELLLNCTCLDAEMAGSSIAAVTGWQMTTQTFHHVRARLFADCSGDSVLAPLTGAAFRVGREARDEFGEDIAPERADAKTMGMSVLIQARQEDHPSTFTPPAWAHRYSREDLLPYRLPNMEDETENFWYIELGGEGDAIRDAEAVRDELLRVAYGIWDFVKNDPEQKEKNKYWKLDWMGILPGKRESRRYVGDYILTQNDVENGKQFPDEVAYGGWQIDNHLPGGFAMSGKDGAHLQKKRLTEPYGIPLRSLYSKNVENLMFAGRNISATHIAFSTVRVMGTCGVMGQAVGTAAAMATACGMLPREFCREKIGELQDALMEDDCFLPGMKRKISPLCNEKTLSAVWGDASNLINGVDRKIWGHDNGYWGMVDRAVTYTFDKVTHLSDFRLIVDSDLDREYTEGNPDVLNISIPLFRRADYNHTTFGFPKCMLKSFKVEIDDGSGEWKTVYETHENHQRMIREHLDVDAKAVRLIPLGTYFSESLWTTYGSAQAHIFSFEVR